MSNSVAGGCLVHYNDQHIQVRKDFFDLCAYNKADFNQGLTKNGKKAKDEPNQECMAKLLRLFETLTDTRKQEWYLKAEKCKAKKIKPPTEPSEYRIELAYSTIAILLYGTYGESTVRNSIAVLLQRGYIKRYQETKNSIPCYVLNVLVLQKALERQAKGDEVSKSTPEESELSNSDPELSNSDPELSNSDPELSNSTPNNIRDKKGLEKGDEKEKATTVQKTSALSVPNASPSLSSQNEKKTDSLEEWYSLFDRLLQEKGYPSNFRVPRNEKNATAIQELISMNATPEQAAFVLNHIWNDKDPFWRQHRGKITTIASQFTTRVCEMHAPVAKRRTGSGLPNWTEDKTIGTPMPSNHVQTPHETVVVDEPTKPVNVSTVPSLPVGYTRLKLEKAEKAQGGGRPSLAELVAAQKKQKA